MLSKSETAVFRPVADGTEAVLLNTETGGYHSVNAIGSLIWELIDGTRDTPAIVAAVIERYPDAPRDEVAGDVEEFLGLLRERDLVHDVPAT